MNPIGTYFGASRIRKSHPTSTEKRATSSQSTSVIATSELLFRRCSPGCRIYIYTYIYSVHPRFSSLWRSLGSCPAYKPDLIRRTSGQPREPTSRFEFRISNSRRLRAVDRYLCAMYLLRMYARVCMCVYRNTLHHSASIIPVFWERSSRQTGGESVVARRILWCGDIRAYVLWDVSRFGYHLALL